MKQVRTNWELVDRVCAEQGIKALPADHPIYSEGPLIMFVHHRPEQSVLKGTPSQPKTSPNDSVPGWEMYDREDHIKKAVQSGYDRYLRTTKDIPPMTFEEYRKVRNEETIP